VFWTKQAAPVPPLPLETAAGDGGARVDALTCAIDQHTADALLHGIPAAKGFGARDVLLAAFADAVSGWTGAAELKVDLDSHGRTEIADDLDLSRTVGWFTAVYPLHLNVDPQQSPDEQVRAVRERAEAVPETGIGYGVIRHLRDDTVSRTLEAAAPAQLSFNYLGRFDSPTATRSGDGRPPLVRQLPLPDDGDRLIAAHHEYPLSLAVAAVDDEMTATWTYRSDLIRPETVRGLAEAWQEAVRRVVDGPPQQSAPVAAEERQTAGAASVAVAAEDPLLLLAAGATDAPELVLVHPVTGSPRGYTHLARLLGGTAAVHGLMAPGLSGEATPLESVPELAEAYLAAMDARGLAEPYRLVGWSFGGLVAYEMAARLTRQGRKVELLGVIDSAAPGGRTLASEDLLGVLFAAEVGRTEPRGPLELTAEDLAGAGPDGVAELVAGELARRRGDRAADWIPHVHALYLVFRANMRAAAGYRPEPGGYPGDLLSIACETKSAADRTLGWPEFVGGRTARHVIPGDHYSIVEPPNVQALADLLLPHLGLGPRTDAAR
jgi:non-ribosomal peptide synthase protein (TIGR01720 family)